MVNEIQYNGNAEIMTFDSSTTDDVVIQNDHPVVPTIMIYNNNKGDPISMVSLTSSTTNALLHSIFFAKAQYQQKNYIHY